MCGRLLFDLRHSLIDWILILTSSINIVIGMKDPIPIIEPQAIKMKRYKQIRDCRVNAIKNPIGFFQWNGNLCDLKKEIDVQVGMNFQYQ